RFNKRVCIKMKNNKCGFTLIELMIAMAIFSMVMTAVYGVYISSSRTCTLQNASAAAQQSVRLGIELMAQDIRMAGFDPAGAGNAGIQVAQANKIEVWADRNYDRDTNYTGSIDNADFEMITYELSGTDLQRILYEGEANKSIQPLIENVTRLEFEYLDSDSNVTANLAEIRTVKILLEVTEPAGMAGSVKRTLVTQVYCRNLDL
ncbi:MAG: prepilin-type N-terminal cleavage/methylation domain-containing protein, partial [Bacteroidales bacterium]|nr:prepilin-type N-terminal cleavage/methylation domain-containing protein [Bacteroidales bacterium]